MCLDPQLANRTIFPTFARTAAMYKHLTPTLLSLFDAFKWKRVAVFIEKTALDEEAAEYVVRKMRSNNITIAVKHYLPSPPNHVPTLDENNELVIKMREAKRKARSKQFIFLLHCLFIFHWFIAIPLNGHVQMFFPFFSELC